MVGGGAVRKNGSLFLCAESSRSWLTACGRKSFFGEKGEACLQLARLTGKTEEG
jgi:hypothetical protein